MLENTSKVLLPITRASISKKISIFLPSITISDSPYWKITFPQETKQELSLTFKNRASYI
jgi:hypothetical protein